MLFNSIHIKCYHVSTNVHFLLLRRNRITSSSWWYSAFYFTRNSSCTTLNRQALINDINDIYYDIINLFDNLSWKIWQFVCVFLWPLRRLKNCLMKKCLRRKMNWLLFIPGESDIYPGRPKANLCTHLIMCESVYFLEPVYVSECKFTSL